MENISVGERKAAQASGCLTGIKTLKHPEANFTIRSTNANTFFRVLVLVTQCNCNKGRKPAFVFNANTEYIHVVTTNDIEILLSIWK